MFANMLTSEDEHVVGIVGTIHLLKLLHICFHHSLDAVLFIVTAGESGSVLCLSLTICSKFLTLYK